MRAVAALVDDQHVVVDVLADHVPRRRIAPAHAADVQAFALAEGEEENAGVFADHVPLRIADLAGPGREVAREEFAEVAFADEADAGRILLRVRGQRGVARDRAHLVLRQIAEREQRRRELRLARAGAGSNSGPCCDPPRAAGARRRGRARRARSGPVAMRSAPSACAASRKCLNLISRLHSTSGFGVRPAAYSARKCCEHAVPVFAREIAEVDRQAEPAADGDRVATIVVGAAVAAAVVGPVLHEQAGDRLARVAQQQRGDRRIDAAGHADDGAHLRCRLHDVASGQLLHHRQRMAAPGEMVGHHAPHQRAAMACVRGLEFGGRHPQRALDALVQRARGVVPYGFGGEGETQVMAACLGLPLVGADERGQAHVPAGFLARFAQRGIDQAFVGLQVAGGLVEDQRPSTRSSTTSNRPSRTTTVATVTSGCQKRPSR